MNNQSPPLHYDAILFVSFGGPEGMSDVMPFLENVLKGRNVPRERMLEVARHYELFAGVSPINEENRKLITALKDELQANGSDLPIYFGNRNWHPMLEDTIKKMRDEGVKNALAFVTSAYSSYSSCRQYLEDIERARALVGPDAPGIEKLRAFYNHPGFIEANVANVRTALERIPEERRANAHLVFTAHSIPETMARNCDYQDQLSETARLITAEMAINEWQLVFQSRSGPPNQPWLGPDVCDYLSELSRLGVVDVVIAPIGFICDHMEVIYDLDLQARQLCEQLGLNMQRAATVGTQPAFVRMIRELISERLDPSPPRKFMGDRRPGPGLCAPDCCAKS
jgi:protoporphyrin/coproporphyrin ferrochelatase